MMLKSCPNKGTKQYNAMRDTACRMRQSVRVLAVPVEEVDVVVTTVNPVDLRRLRQTVMVHPVQKTMTREIQT